MKFRSRPYRNPRHSGMKYAQLAAIAIMLGAAADAPTGFEVSYAAGASDAAGNHLAGTEIRNLVAHDGKLFAANGYWKETPRGPFTPGPRVPGLDRVGKAWRG